jgi:imidazolonepropionase-like amidohydrolase
VNLVTGVDIAGRIDHRRLVGAWRAGEASGDLLAVCAGCSSKRDRYRDDRYHENDDDDGEDNHESDDGDGEDNHENDDGNDEPFGSENGRHDAADEDVDTGALMRIADNLPYWPPLPEPAPPAVLVKNATVWTLGPEGTLSDTDLLCRNGTIERIGRDLDAPRGALEIDATGRHVTPGLIDIHSHSFIDGGVNECTNDCTAEVRIEDVIDAETPHLYRQLAGGVTMALELHGSCNTIGGQNATVKLRWGAPAAELLYAPAPPTIKFALGENPKRSNWDDLPFKRFPTTRPGIEQSLRERFMAARDYRREQEEWQRHSSKDRIPPRRDLQLEPLAEVLRGERIVHCHAYRQDEILMFVRVAEEFGFNAGVFVHGLEAYKVADELAAHGAAVTTFSDWWAYKFEVYDAIPYNGTLLWKRGVLTTFNSDSSELARRLNLEATKAVRYGGMPEDEALALVSRNAAQQLRVGDRVGTLEAGKEADFVIWRSHPLALDTVCDETWIDGRRYFDRQRDLEAREAAEAGRRELLAAAKRHWKPEKKRRGSGAWSPTFGARQAESEEEAGYRLVLGTPRSEREGE